MNLLGGVAVEYVTRALAFILVPIVVEGVLGYLRQPKKGEAGKVYLPKLLALIGAIGSTIFLIPAFITIFLGEPIWIPTIFVFVSSLGAILIIAFANCRITYDEEGFVAKTFFGIKRKYTYAQVTAIKENAHESYIYIGKKRIMVDEVSIGGTDFIACVKQKYAILHEGQSLPVVHKTNHNINGNINNAGG